jgi:hypothetical protein
MKKNSMSKLALNKSTVQNLNQQTQEKMKGGITGNCPTRPRTTQSVLDLCPQTTLGDFTCDYTCTSIGGTFQYCCL